jgi:signal transduction histidine kinase
MKFKRLKSQAGLAALPGLFKAFIFFGTITIAALFVIYTQFLITRLQDYIKRDVRMWAKLWELAGAEDSSPRVNAVIFEEIIQKAYFPIIVTDHKHHPVLWARIPGVADNDTTETGYNEILKKSHEMEQANGETPVSWNGQVIQYILYDYPPLVQQLQLMPFIEIGVVGVFLIVGFVGFRNIQRSEQRNIWVGMAKETAHQLGTPLSSMMGWLELLESKIESGEIKEEFAGSNGLRSVLSKMQNDVRRLDRVANRFGQIGSIPETRYMDLNPLIQEVVTYYCQRLPHGGKGIRIEFTPGEDICARVNPELFTWVIENLIKNSLQATDQKTGLIKVASTRVKEGKIICVTVTDTGSGIPANLQKKVFQTGFSTKKRGWGLGLSLARRIIQDYHNGRIFLKESIPNEHTTFQISLDYCPGPDSAEKGRA